MEIVFSNPLIYIINYPAQDAIELYDRRSGRVGLMQGELAEQFRHEFGDLLASEPALDAFADFIDDYGPLLTHSVIRH